MVPNPITWLLGDVEMHRGVDLLSKVSAEAVQFSPLSTLTEGGAPAAKFIWRLRCGLEVTGGSWQEGTNDGRRKEKKKKKKRP